MPKRKQSDSKLSDIMKKLRKLEKHVEGRKPRRKRIISSSSEDTRSSEEHNAEEQRNLPTFRTNEYDEDSVLVDILPTPKTSNPVLSTAHVSENDGDNIITLSTEDLVPAETQDELILDSELLDILGEDPTVTVQYGKHIHSEVANRLEFIATSGLNKDNRKELCEKYLIPGNCTKIGAPILNLEIKSALPEAVIKRDKFIEARQKRLAAAISCLTMALSTELEAKQKNNAMLKHLMDTCRLLCDIQHDESMTRRNFAVASLKKESNIVTYNTKIDSCLFGENLAESLKAAKAVTKSGTELKANAVNKNLSSKFSQKNNLNWKPPVAARRQPTTSRSREPAAAAPVPPPPPPPPRRPARAASSRAPQPPPPPRYTRKR